ncbi:MAG: hypothetical protein JW800_03655, partial [Candidatus Omnitrophica bacterium]|nr:hypothetical protein [Candidatus Omnitrophota bacterium]
ALISSPLGVPIDVSSIELRLDGNSVTPRILGNASNRAISYTPSSQLSLGNHNVTLNGRDINGIPAQESSWSFSLIEEQPPPPPEQNPPIITDEKPTGSISDLTPTVSARIYSPDAVNIIASSIVMKLDGNPVTYTASGSGSSLTVSYTPSSDLTYGNHVVYMYGEDSRGLGVSKNWIFKIVTAGSFVVTVPEYITVGKNFIMRLVAYDVEGNPMNGEGGGELYAEDVNITVSGFPSPQGRLTVTKANAGEWLGGIWSRTQKYYNSGEHDYTLTITATDAGGAHEGMTGSAETIVKLQELEVKHVGSWTLNSGIGSWNTFSSAYEDTSSFLCCAWYNDDNGYRRFHGAPYAAYLYWIKLPDDQPVNNIRISLRIGSDDTFVSSVHKKVEFILENQHDIIPSAPPDVTAEVKIDYSFATLQGASTPYGEHNLIHDYIGGGPTE